MRVGVNALFLLPGVVGGSETYTRELLRAMAADSPDEFVVFCNRENYGTFREGGNVREALCPVAARSRLRRLVMEQVRLPALAARERIDVLFSPGCTMPYACGLPQVVTIHDMQCYLYPQNFPWHYRLVTRRLWRMSGARSDHVLTFSEASARDIRQFCGVPAERITPIHLGVAQEFFDPLPQSRRQELLAEAGVAPPFLLTVSNSYPHKNLDGLLRAYARLESATECRLVVVGPARTNESELEAIVGRLKDRRRVVRCHRVTQETLRALYQSAQAFVLPSFYEGFGLPLVEAMAGGTPVACSRIPVFEEVAGDAAAYFDPNDPQDMAGAIGRLLTDGPERERRVRAGLARSRSFTWRATAERTLAVLRRVAT